MVFTQSYYSARIYRLMRFFQGWRNSVKATHFVMAIHDYFSAKTSTALDEIRAIANKTNATSSADNLKDIALIAEQAVPAEDMWALEYITVHRAQPLLEALDEDGSSFITINEVNTFTASRPEGWRYAPCTTISEIRAMG